MKKMMLVTLISTIMLGTLPINGVFADSTITQDKVSNIQNQSTRRVKALLSSDPTNVSVQRLKKQGAKVIPNTNSLNPVLLKTPNDDYTTVTPSKGSGIDSSGNVIPLDIQKGAVKDQYYLDNATNNDRVEHVNYASEEEFMGQLLFVSEGLLLSMYDYSDDPAIPVTSETSHFNDPKDSGKVTAANQIQNSMDYFKEKFNWVGADNNQTPLNNYLVNSNITLTTPDNDFTFNAFSLFSPGISQTLVMGFGAGGTMADKYTFKEFDKDRTAVAHEYSHGVVESLISLSGTNDFETMGLREGLPDVFAASMLKTWEIGTQGFNVANDDTSFRRNLANPAKYNIPNINGEKNPYPTKYSELATGEDGHYSGSVVGHQYYLMSEGGQFNGQTITGIGLEKAEQIVFSSLSKLPASPKFADYRDALIATATNQYGATSAEVQAVQASLDATEFPLNNK